MTNADDLVARAYEEHADRLIRLARLLVGPSDASDVVASAVLRTLAAGRSRVIREPDRYLSSAVYNESRRLLGRRSRSRLAMVRLASRPVSDLDEEGDHGLEVLAGLSTRQRAVIFLTYWSDLTPAQVADHLGISEGAVRRHLARARDHLRKGLADVC
jgi:RNA polymerase sigma factor (sigma-70 family)